MILAVEDGDIPSLKALKEKALANGVIDVRLLEPREITKMEPNIAAKRALLSPSTGIIDTHSLMKRLVKLAQQGGAFTVYRHELVSIEFGRDGCKMYIKNPDSSQDAIHCTSLINCAVLYADRVASWLGIDVDKEEYRIHPCKGEYFSIKIS